MKVRRPASTIQHQATKQPVECLGTEHLPSAVDIVVTSPDGDAVEYDARGWQVHTNRESRRGEQHRQESFPVSVLHDAALLLRQPGVVTTHPTHQQKPHVCVHLRTVAQSSLPSLDQAQSHPRKVRYALLVLVVVVLLSSSLLPAETLGATAVLVKQQPNEMSRS